MQRLDGKLALMTPEGVRLSLTPAGPARRALAWALDFLLWMMAVGATAALLQNFGNLGDGIFLIILFASYWGYPILCEVYWGGKTVGKLALGLEVVRADGLPVGWRESTLRNLLLVADFMPFLYAAGLLTMLFDRHFRRIGDLVAGTLVVYRQKARPRAKPLTDTPEALPYPLPPEQQRALLDLIERADRLPPARTQELADLAEPLTGLRGAASLARLRAFAAGLTKGKS